MVVATGVNDTLELASPRRRGSSSSDVVPEDDGIEQSAAGATADGAERPMEDSMNELLATAWHFDQRVRCTAGHIVGVLTRLANDTGPDPLADGKTRSLRSRISGGTKWLGLRSKSKSPKFGADRKQLFPDDAVARPHP